MSKYWTTHCKWSLLSGIGAFTFRSGNGKSVNDYLLTDEEMFNSLTAFSVGEKWPNSDHHPLYFSLGITNQLPVHESHEPKDRDDMYSKFIWDDDNEPVLNSCLFDEIGTQHLNEFYDSIRELESVEYVAAKFNTYILQACQRSLKRMEGTFNL